ncbi:sensor histidine kinase [Ohessyouella blattaphilus]|uniref:Sensor histidine kinase n=1 Tax=Ohessyouella blattaphilus TaxID=2949333 RepID=A0ABT1EFN1_9FIRM|nr:sensor histidine kinase [Ohessyouella blattaphilus]MCP1109509.1 sensor histidine kinase [Ohessyouella blattaphilus]MCR8562903.1 sensor histidine kinase [Ohessyouella blattaphilus]MDL2250104.1 sensor histidine kinase [Lachnospiraceae bacterium OttesenSCG-928-J05]
MKKKLSIIWIAILLCCALVLTPVLCTLAYFNHTVSSRLKNTAKETASFYLDQYADETASILDTLRSTIHYLTTDTLTQEYMRKTEPPSQMERLTIEEGLGKVFLLGNLPDSNVVTGIYLLKDDEQYLSILRSGIFQGTAARMKQVYQECGTANSARDLYITPSYPDYCYYIVDYLNMETMKPLGKVIIELNSHQFINASSIDTIYKNAVVQLRNTNSAFIAGDGGTGFTTLPTPTSEDYVTIDGSTYYHTGRQLSPNNLQIDLYIPEQEIFETIHSTTKISVLFTMLVLFITLVAGILLFHFVFKPVKQMAQKLDRLATGDLTVRMELTPYQETDQIAVAFNDMTGQLKELFEEVYTKGLLLRDAEFNLLESQIRPHFIFNVLELVNMRCLASGQDDICRIVSNLAQLLRANIIHKHQQVITFEDELGYVRYYLELQKERFEEKLTYTIDLEDPVILNYYLPKLTIQPLVENSIVHGLENKREGGFVNISIWEEVDSICVRISDNGIGFDTDSINWDVNSPTDENAPHNHVALQNINRRIQLLYGEPYKMTITSIQGEGTDILLTLPVNHTQDSGKEGPSIA